MGQPNNDASEVYYTGLEELTRHMVAVSGLSGAQVSRNMGRSSNFLWSMLRNKSTPRLDLFITIAKECGYRVELRGQGESFVLVDHDFLGPAADAFPDARVLALSTIDDSTMALVEVPDVSEDVPAGGMNAKHIEWSTIEPMTEEEFAEQDPEGYAEYRREMDQLEREALDLQERMDNLREGFINGVRETLLDD